MARKHTYTLLIPTINEIEGMKVIMPQVKREWVDQILFLDKNSTDGTVEYIRDHGYDLVVQTRPGLWRGYMEALPQVRGDVLVTFSPDGNSIPEAIPRLVEKMEEGYDMAIASRYAPGAESEDDDLLTGFGNWMFTTLINVLHRGRYTDAMGIYRAYRKQIIFDLGLDREESYRTPERLFRTVFSWEPLLSVRAARRGLRIVEIPASEPKRIGGQRKLLPFRWGSAFLYQIFREVFS